MRCKTLLALAALSVGCNRAVPTREAAIEAARTLELAADLSVELDGALITTCPDDLTTPEGSDAPVVCVRLTAFDAEIRVVDSGCAPRAVRVHVQNAASDAVVGWRAFRAGESTARAATRACCETLLNPNGDERHPDWTPLGPEVTLDALDARSCGESRGLCWTSTARPGTDQAWLTPWTTAALTAASGAACVSLSAPQAGTLRAAPFVLAQRVRATLRPVATDDGPALDFVVIGNTGEDTASLERLVARVNAEDVPFVVLSGDIAANGSDEALDRARRVLDALEVPFFMTLGEKDADGADPVGLVDRFGASTDVLLLPTGQGWQPKVVLLDSAEGGLSAKTFAALPDYLAPGSPPGAAIVVTHTPPFDPSGLRGAGFKRRGEGARLLAALSRAGVAAVITGHLNEPGADVQSGVEIVHGGARHFVRVRVNEAGRVSVQRLD